MRRLGGLFEEICSFRNLWLAARKAERGKRYRPDVLAFNLRRQDHLHALRRALVEGTWRPSPHRHFEIFEPKRRWVSAAPFPDRVVHHALCNVIEPVIDRRLVADCWANRNGKGSHRAVLRYQQLAGRFRYVLKVDLQKYFPSIDHRVLQGQLRRIFKDASLLHLMDRIIEEGKVPQPFIAYLPGDDLFTPFDRPKGLPIGNLTSQLWANLYLSGFDHWVKQELRPGGYLRFVDDFILLGDSKERLLEWRDRVEDRLFPLRLLIHPRKSVIRRTDEGIPFLGYVVWPTRIRVRGETVRRYRRRFRRRPLEEDGRRRSLAAWKGHVRWAGGWRRVKV